jgi:hypothetical protein
MKDHVFSGADLPEALALAAANLGLPLAELRYVVLEAARRARAGFAHTRADRGAAARGARPACPPGPGWGADRGTRRPTDPTAGIRDTLRAIAEAGGLKLSAEIEDGPEAVIVHLQGTTASSSSSPTARPRSCARPNTCCCVSTAEYSSRARCA